MKKTYQAIAFSALVFLLLSTACAGAQRHIGTTSAEATALAAGQTLLPPGTNTLTTLVPGTDTALLPEISGTASSSSTGAPSGGGGTPQVPVTGVSMGSLLCEFCVDQIAHAVILLPQNATFQVNAASGTGATAGTTCNAIEQINSKQVVVCYGAPESNFDMNVCINSNCAQFPVRLDPCPLQQDQAQPADTAVPEASNTPATVPVSPEPTGTATP